MNVEAPYLSLSEVARQANAPASRVRKADKLGKLAPDFTVAGVRLYKKERLDELKAILGVQTVH